MWERVAPSCSRRGNRVCKDFQQVSILDKGWYIESLWKYLSLYHVKYQVLEQKELQWAKHLHICLCWCTGCLVQFFQFWDGLLNYFMFTCSVRTGWSFTIGSFLDSTCLWRRVKLVPVSNFKCSWTQIVVMFRDGENFAVEGVLRSLLPVRILFLR